MEATSEEHEYPVTGPLQSPPSNEWRAAEAGLQVIKMQFGAPQPIRRVRVVFRETASARTQEFVLVATAATGERREIVRQQYTFAPDGGATSETEEYAFALDDVLSLELHIVPDISHGPAKATLAEMRLA